ncbi:MAG TPA: hypothetical protein VK982_11745 [Bacteroidales bacterium]|nr:hypothetical protein [Bacteroidales bacterium]
MEDKIIDKITDKVLGKLSAGLFTILDTVLDVIAIGLIIYMIYRCIRFMFFAKNEDIEYYLFSWLLFLLVRITNTILSAKLGG